MESQHGSRRHSDAVGAAARWITGVVSAVGTEEPSCCCCCVGRTRSPGRCQLFGSGTAPPPQSAGERYRSATLSYRSAHRRQIWAAAPPLLRHAPPAEQHSSAQGRSAARVSPVRRFRGRRLGRVAAAALITGRDDRRRRQRWDRRTHRHAHRFVHRHGPIFTAERSQMTVKSCLFFESGSILRLPVNGTFHGGPQWTRGRLLVENDEQWPP